MQVSEADVRQLSFLYSRETIESVKELVQIMFFFVFWMKSFRSLVKAQARVITQHESRLNAIFV